MATKRLRVFAGPNGSGKSTIFTDISTKDVDMGVFINADRIEKELTDTGRINLSDYYDKIDIEDIVDEYLESGLYDKSRCRTEDFYVEENNVIVININKIDSYFAAFIADYLRYSILGFVNKITIETVMSDISKLDYFQSAIENGYRIYLYYISTKSPEINIQRVYARQLEGGHSVPEEKISSRYNRSLENILGVLKVCHRAYFFDNSESRYKFIAEYDKEKEYLFLKQDEIPFWFKTNVYDKLNNQQ